MGQERKQYHKKITCLQNSNIEIRKAPQLPEILASGLSTLQKCFSQSQEFHLAAQLFWIHCHSFLFRHYAEIAHASVPANREVV